MQLHLTSILGFLVLLIPTTPPSMASVAEFTSFISWQDAVDDYQSITFTDYPKFTFITDQYQDLGVLFVDGDDNIQINNDGFPPDTFGLDGNQSITMEFTTPQYWLGVTYPGNVQISLLSGDSLIFASGPFSDQGTLGAFAGLVSDESFDRVVLFDPIDSDVNIGDLYFGPPIPSPGALGLVMFGIAACGRKRRR